MKKRTMAKQLVVGDHFKVKDGRFQVEKILEEEDGAEHLRFVVKLLPCRNDCPRCDDPKCLYSLFDGRDKPICVSLRPDDRLGYLGNIDDLLKESEAIKQRIALLQQTTNPQRTEEHSTTSSESPQ